MTPGRDTERISALAAGLAATTIIWTFAAAYAPATVEAMGEYSPWLYGPVSTGAWALFSAIAYLLIDRKGQQTSPRHLDETYCCRDLGLPVPIISPSLCANRDEKNRLEAVTAGFALTVTAWVVALSLMPADWLDSVSAAPAWVYCVGSVGLWAALRAVMYSIISAANGRRLKAHLDSG